MEKNFDRQGFKETGAESREDKKHGKGIVNNLSRRQRSDVCKKEN
jgi:hypothetical protein